MYINIPSTLPTHCLLLPSDKKETLLFQSITKQGIEISKNISTGKYLKNF